VWKRSCISSSTFPSAPLRVSYLIADNDRRQCVDFVLLRPPSHSQVGNSIECQRVAFIAPSMCSLDNGVDGRPFHLSVCNDYELSRQQAVSEPNCEFDAFESFAVLLTYRVGPWKQVWRDLRADLLYNPITRYGTGSFVTPVTQEATEAMTLPVPKLPSSNLRSIVFATSQGRLANSMTF